MKAYEEKDVVLSLNKKHDIKILGKTVSVLYGSMAKNDIGIKSRGKVDFLHHYCGYNVQYVHKF